MPAGALVSGVLAKALGEDFSSGASDFVTGYQTGDEMLAQARQRQQQEALFHIKLAEAQRAERQAALQEQDRKRQAFFEGYTMLEKAGVSEKIRQKYVMERGASAGIPVDEYVAAAITTGDEEKASILGLWGKASRGPLSDTDIATLTGYGTDNPMVQEVLKSHFQMLGPEGPIGAGGAGTLASMLGLDLTPAQMQELGKLNQGDARQWLGEITDSKGKAGDGKMPSDRDFFLQTVEDIMSGKSMAQINPVVYAQAKAFAAGEGQQELLTSAKKLDEQRQALTDPESGLPPKGGEGKAQYEAMSERIARMLDMAGQPLDLFTSFEEKSDPSLYTNRFLSDAITLGKDGRPVAPSVEDLRGQLVSALTDQFGQAPEGSSKWAEEATAAIKDWEAQLKEAGYKSAVAEAAKAEEKAARRASAEQAMASRPPVGSKPGRF